MPMTDFIVKEAILPNLTATGKEAAIREIIDSLRATGHIDAGVAEEIVRAVIKREQLGSTGIGRGIAIPHAKHPSLDRLTGAIALSKAGVPFESIDGEPVYVFVLLISPQDRPGDHLRALENVVRLMRDDNFVKLLREADSKDAVWKLLDDPPENWGR